MPLLPTADTDSLLCPFCNAPMVWASYIPELLAQGHLQFPDARGDWRTYFVCSSIPITNYLLGGHRVMRVKEGYPTARMCHGIFPASYQNLDVVDPLSNRAWQLWWVA